MVGLGFAAELLGVQVVVMPAGSEQFLVRAHLGDLPVVDEDDAVGALDGGQPVGDDEAGASLHQSIHPLLDERFGQGVDRAGGFIHDEDLRLGQDCPGQADELLLPDG